MFWKVWKLGWSLRSSDWTRRLAAVKALSQLRTPLALKPLIRALNDPHQGVQGAAAEALSTLGTTAVPILVERLSIQNLDLLRHTIELLGEIGDHRASAPIAGLLRDSQWPVRQQAALSLGELGDESVVEALVTALHDAEEPVQRAAAASLGMLGNRKALEALVKHLKEDEDPVRRYNVIEPLWHINDLDAVGPLIQALEDADWRVRAKAAQGLGRLGDKRAVAALRRAKDDTESTVSDAVYASLRRLGIEEERPTDADLDEDTVPTTAIDAWNGMSKIDQDKWISIFGGFTAFRRQFLPSDDS